MNYGPGDNRIIIAADGDSIESGFVKTKAQFDALYDRLAEDLSPATSTKAGIVRIASQTETDTGSADAPVITPLKLASSVFAAKAAENTDDLAAFALSADALRSAIDKLSADARNALAAASAVFGVLVGGNDVMEKPAAGTFKVMPAAAPYPYTPAGGSYSRNRYEIRLPLNGRWIYCGSLKYHWTETGTGEPDEGDAEVPLCGVADGGTVIWGDTSTNRAITSHKEYGFIWRTATRENYEPGDTSVSGGVFGDSTSDTVSGGSL